jgi:XRE family transcriptional regulator, regulator of sulfur utilization
MNGSWRMPVRVRSSDHVALGRAVLELRGRSDVSQYVLAFDAGVNDKYVSKLEQGGANPGFAILLRIARTLGCPLAELVEMYDRHLAEIDQAAGRDVRLCPTPEALAYARQLNDREHAKRLSAMGRGRMRSWT